MAPVQNAEARWRQELQGVVNWASISRGANFLERARQSLKLVKIRGLRCAKCGFLELFAQPPAHRSKSASQLIQ
jgi:hypothetical protein